MKKVYFLMVATATLLAFAITVTAAPRPKITFDGSSSDRWGTSANWTLTGGSARVPASGDSIVIAHGQSVYIDATTNLNNVIIVLQYSAILTIGNSYHGSGALVLDNNSAVSLESTGTTNRAKLTANYSFDNSNKLTIGGSTKFQGGTTYNINSGSGYATITGPARATAGSASFLSGTLPVVLMGFGANLTSTNTVKIDWNTQQEINTDRFEVLRSSEGINWQTLATIKATGFSSSPKNYSFTDPAPQKGVNLYRLKTIDLDGNFGFSGVTNVHLDIQGKISVFPNPTINLVTVSLGEAPASDWTISLRNLFGQTVLVKKFGKDYSTASLNVGNFPTGNYSIEINIGSSRQIAKLVIAH